MIIFFLTELPWDSPLTDFLFSFDMFAHVFQYNPFFGVEITEQVLKKIKLFSNTVILFFKWSR
jgi:hypothetical protein